MDWFWNLIDAGRRFTPHGYCLFWEPELVWTHVISDALIATAYFSIPIALLHVMRRRRDIQFSYILLLFAIFIMACGSSHLMAIWTIWRADYGWEALVKVVTAASSIATAIVLWRLIPQLLLIPSSAQLKDRNDQLEAALAQLTLETEERKRVEEALLQAHKMEAVGQLTGGIAHDFNNLLQAVSGSLELIQRQPQSDKIPRWAELGQQAADRGARLASQLLTFSRMQKLALRPCEVGPLILGMRDLLTAAVGSQIDLHFELAGPDYVSVMGDPTQIELAVMNLAINARDAMPDGGTISIATRTLELNGDLELPDGSYLELIVSDDGAGMPEHVRVRAFEPFFTTKGVGKGTGLGLSMVYGMASQSGGRAEIRSSETGGTAVAILLKVVSSNTAKEPTKPEALASPAQPMRILLVDDDHGALETGAALLHALGHTVVRAGSGKEGLDILGGFEPDLLILDYAMPTMNGAEVARQVRDAGIDIPILFSTGFADVQAIESAVGWSPILKKPYSLEALSAAVGAAVAQSRGDQPKP